MPIDQPVQWNETMFGFLKALCFAFGMASQHTLSGVAQTCNNGKKDLHTFVNLLFTLTIHTAFWVGTSNVWL